MTTELQAIYTNQKSFYGKAQVEYTPDNHKILYSYNTKVCELNADNQIIEIGYYSQTTSRHINDFLQQNGYKKMSKKEIEKLESEC